MPPTVLKALLSNLPDHYFETYAFSELSVGDKFIAFPLPVSGSDTPLLKEVLIVHTKTQHVVTELKGVHYATPHGRATSKMRTRLMDFPHDTPVIRVQ